jgi:2-phospho-L-lactate guanylyltransferase (CobY/MobA/RfbA family)
MEDEMRKEVLGEVLMDELRVIREYVEDIPIIKKKVTKLESDMEEVKTDVKAIKAVVREHDREIRILKQKTA